MQNITNTEALLDKRHAGLSSSYIYPKRQSYFAVKYSRLITDRRVAQEVGPLAALLLMIVAHQEDANRYERGATFYDGQLMPILGINSKKTMTSTRRKLIEGGWLHFEPGHKGKASNYWVLIPATPTLDENLSDGYGSLKEPNNTQESKKGTERGADGEPNGGLYIPIPIPHPHHQRDDDVSVSKENEPLPSRNNPLASLSPPSFVIQGLPSYSGVVISAAWKVTCRFTELNPVPRPRSRHTAVKIVSRFAGAISANGIDYATATLINYYSLTDPAKWQQDVDAGLRLAIDATPLAVCAFLFPKSRKVKTGSLDTPSLPDANDFHAQKQAEYEALQLSEQQRKDAL